MLLPAACSTGIRSVLVREETRYARPHVVLDDGHSHRVMLECKVLVSQRRTRKKAGGDQWVFGCNAVSLDTVLVLTEAPPVPDQGD
jgi:hypothetical protein